MEEPGAPEDDEAELEEEEEEAPRKRRGPWLKIIAIVVVAAVAGIGVWVAFFSNGPPTAAFTVRSVDLRAFADARNSTDPEGNIQEYQWDWGDGRTNRSTEPFASHVYANEGTYSISLVVADARGASSGAAARNLQIRVYPTAHFIARHDRMTVSFDASDSFHALDVAITNYAWDFGDLTTDTTSGPVVAHTYSSESRYLARLTVADARGDTSTATRYVSPASTTVDIVASEFFEAGCPFRDYWNNRFASYGDRILWGDPARGEGVPCTDYYPWVMFSSSVNLQRINPSYVYSVYRWDARVRNHGGYNVWDPVMFPVFNPSVSPAAGSRIDVDLSFEYLDTPLFSDLRLTPFSVNRKYYSDGFGGVLRGNLTMDLAMAQRLFGMRAAVGKFPTAIDGTGGASGWDGAAWGAFPALPPRPPSGRWSDLVVTSDNTALAIANDSTVFRLLDGGSAWTPFITPPAAAWAKPTTDVVAIASDHADTFYAVTRGDATTPISPSVYRYTGSAPGQWTLVANLTADHAVDSGGIADLVHVGGVGSAGDLRALPVSPRLARDPVARSPTLTPTTTGWTNPRNAFTSDNRYTNAIADGAVGEYQNYSIASIAGEVQIHRVEIGIEGKTTGDDDVVVEFSTNGGSSWTPAGTFSPGTTDSTAYFDVTSLRTWDFSLLSNANFRTRIVYAQVGGTATSVDVDWVPVSVKSGFAGLLRTANGGAAWTTFGTVTPADAAAENVGLAVQNPSTVHVLLSNGSILRTTNGAVSWSWIPKASTSPGGPWHSVAWDGRNGLWAVADAASGAEVWRVDLVGGAWANRSASFTLSGPVSIGAADPQQWWHAQTVPYRTAGALESRYASWLEGAGNGQNDVYNGFEWFYETDITDLNGTVALDGTTRVSMFFSGWAYDVLQARWFYWGNASYQQAVCVKGNHTETVQPPLLCDQTRPYGAIQPRGWMPMETCWCEQATIRGRIGSSLDLDFSAIQGYSFQAWGNAGPDGFPGTDDDTPAWVFVPNLMDYVPPALSSSLGASGFPNSELRWYEITGDGPTGPIIDKKTSYHMAPGSYGYGTRLEYLVAPTRWPLRAGSTFTMVLPRFEVPWYDPVRSQWNPDTKIGDYRTFNSTMDLRLIRPAGNYFLWDERAKVLSIAGPHSWGLPDTELPLEGWPWVEFGPEVFG